MDAALEDDGGDTLGGGDPVRLPTSTSVAFLFSGVAGLCPVFVGGKGSRAFVGGRVWLGPPFVGGKGSPAFVGGRVWLGPAFVGGKGSPAFVGGRVGVGPAFVGGKREPVFVGRKVWLGRGCASRMLLLGRGFVTGSGPSEVLSGSAARSFFLT